MQRFVLIRLLQGLGALFVLSIIIFGLTRLTGSPIDVMLPMDATPQDRVAMEQTLGLDQPLPVQYVKFMSGAVRGDFGVSIRARRPVNDFIWERLFNSLKLTAAAMGITLVMGGLLGVISAVKKGTWIDNLSTIIGVLGQCMPTFWLGIVLVEVFSANLHLLPSSGIGGIQYYVLPAFTMGWFITAGMMRLLRSSMLDVLDSEYVKLARIKGVPERTVIWKHALRNALIPVVTFGGVYFATALTAAIVVETVFAWPGLGRLSYEALMYRDFPVMQAVILVAGAIAILANLGVDILYCYIDPRIKYGD